MSMKFYLEFILSLMKIWWPLVICTIVLLCILIKSENKQSVRSKGVKLIDRRI